MVRENLDTIEILKQLVTFPSITPNEAGSLGYIQEFIEKMGGSCVRVDRNETTNLFASIGNGNQIFAFAGHVDVVPPGDIEKWHNQQPFCVNITNDQVIGRGVADMKGAIAAFLVALSKFVANKISSDYRILLLLTSDEEGSATDGTILLRDYLIDNNIRLNYCLVGEPSCVDQLGDTIKVGRRGSLTGYLTIRGIQGHIAYPHLCLNPIHAALPALATLTATNWDSGNEYFPATSFQIANLNSGLGVTNVIPGELTANFNFRYNNIHDNHELQAKVEEVLDQFELDYSINWNHSAKPFLTKVDKLVDYATQAIYEVTGVTAILKTDGGTSDGRFLIDVSDELIELGLRNESIHQINESTTLSDLEALTNVYYSILSKVFNGEAGKS